jgi:alkyldihydroxyacetonephosphate synthase
MRHLAQSGDVPTVLRLSDEAETAISLTTADSGATAAGRGCVLLAGYEGTAERVGRLRSAVTSRLTELGGSCLGEDAGQVWARARFEAPYLRDALLDAGVLVETLETATFWSRLENLYAAVRGALAASLGTGGEPAIVLCHISHVYETGASLYFTVATTQGGDPLARWDAAKTAASDAIRAHGGTITHHHAVGRDHVPWYAQEIGEVGVSVMRAVKAELDPAGILNPGVLIP